MSISYKKSDLVNILSNIDLGSSIAELDNLLEAARIETSVFKDLIDDKIDLVPGTKGSGKSALFRIFVDFLPKLLLKDRKVVIAHGIQKQGDTVFHAFKNQFEKLSEDQFISFWCIYFVSLVHEQFIKGDIYSDYLKDASKEIENFKRACANARIPEIKARKTLKEILEWVLNALKTNSPKLTYKLPQDSGEIELDLFGRPKSEFVKASQNDDITDKIPTYANEIKSALESILAKVKLNIWLMVDRLDEIFPRRTNLESRALRGLLKTMRLFTSESIRIKVFLRDDIFENLLSTKVGFTALTHITARQADTLKWSEDQILSMIVKRFFANPTVSEYFKVNIEKLNSSFDYRKRLFYLIFPNTIHRGENQSTTSRWLFNHCADARGVVTPRDIIDLLKSAKQFQHDTFLTDPQGKSDYLIGSVAIQHGHEELSKRKRTTYLEAEFPHLWPDIRKFINGKSEYSASSISKILGPRWKTILDDLISIGVISEIPRKESTIYKFPSVYWSGLNLSRGKA